MIMKYEILSALILTLFTPQMPWAQTSSPIPIVTPAITVLPCDGTSAEGDTPIEDQRPYRLIRSEKEWNRLYNIRPRWPNPAKVDFSKNMLVRLAYSTSAGDSDYQMGIKSICALEGEIKIRYYFFGGRDFKPGEPRAMFILNKTLDVVLPQSALPIIVTDMNPQPMYNNVLPDLTATEKNKTTQKLEGQIPREVETAVKLDRLPPLRLLDVIIHYANEKGIGSDDWKMVYDFASSYGLEQSVRTDQFNLYLSGQVRYIEKAFHVKLYNYQRQDGTVFYAPENEPIMNFDIPVKHVDGLDDCFSGYR
jgi:hypothetical protein